MVIFLCPETKFARPAFAIDGQLTKVDEYGNMVVLSDEEAKAMGDREGDNRLHAEEAPKEYTYVNSLSLMQPIEKNALRVALTSYWQMALALTNPAIVWALGAASAVLGITIAQSLSFGGILGHTYHWKPENVGLNYLGALPAAALAFLTCGWGGDKVNLYLARRNGGVHLPEHRVSTVFCFASSLQLTMALPSVTESDLSRCDGNRNVLDVWLLRSVSPEHTLDQHSLQ
jgi:hypothetical protein